MVKFNKDNLQARDDMLAGIYGERFLTLEYNSKASEQDEAKKMLDKLMGKIYEQKVQNLDADVLNRLVKIYENNEMTDVLYAYTRVLMNQADGDLYRKVVGKYEEVIKKLEDFEREHEKELPLYEYLLYAKCSLKKMHNEIHIQKGFAERYEVGELLKDIERIYEYDAEFYHTEHLKAKVAVQDIMYNGFARQYWDRCIKNCNIEVCKSFLYYELGKWMDNNQQVFEAGKAYELALRYNPMNDKAVFKQAIAYKMWREEDEERMYLERLSQKWERHSADRQWLGLMDLEYVYKAYRLLGDLESDWEYRQGWYDKAQEVVDYVQDGLKEPDEHSFVSLLYQSESIPKICDAMSGRLVNTAKCLERYK